MDGPGVYDSICTYVRERTDAKTVLLFVVDGNLGSGLSVQTANLALDRRLPHVLRALADQIELTNRTVS